MSVLCQTFVEERRGFCWASEPIPSRRRGEASEHSEAKPSICQYVVTRSAVVLASALGVGNNVSVTTGLSFERSELFEYFSVWRNDVVTRFAESGLSYFSSWRNDVVIFLCWEK